MPQRSRAKAWVLLFLLLVFAVGTCALVARLAYWQVIDQERLAAEALSQTTVTLDTPSKRGDIFDRTGTVVLATTVERERLVAAPDQLTADQRHATATAIVGGTVRAERVVPLPALGIRELLGEELTIAGNDHVYEAALATLMALA